jgi:hypothetical protein
MDNYSTIVKLIKKTHKLNLFKNKKDNFYPKLKINQKQLLHYNKS